jgi:hypothetical protein
MLTTTNNASIWTDPRFKSMWGRIVQITFAAFMGSLVCLLVLLYADVPIVSF